MAPPTLWKSADGTVERTLLSEVGTGDGAGAGDSAAPGEGRGAAGGLCQPGAQCRLLVEPESPVPAGLDLSDPVVSDWLPAGQAQLGEADTELDRLLERCLLTLRPGDHCRARLRLRPDRLPVPRGSQQEMVLTLRLGVLAASGGQPDAALTHPQRLALAERARLRGNELFAAGRAVDAFHRYRRALALLVYLWPPALDEAEQRVAAAAKLSCRANLAAVQLRRGRHAAARAAAGRVLAEQPDHVRCLYRRGAASLALQDHEEAERDLARLLQLEPQNAAAAQQMALLQRRRRELDQRTAGYMTKYFQQ